MVELRVEVVPYDALPVREAAELRYRALHEPVGVARDDEWHDDAPGISHVIATADGALVGYARLVHEGELGRVRQLAVEREWRRRGVGTRLMAVAEEEARRRGERAIEVEAREGAWEFYERLGFVTDGGPFAFGRSSLQHLRMRLSLVRDDTKER